MEKINLLWSNDLNIKIIGAKYTMRPTNKTLNLIKQ